MLPDIKVFFRNRGPGLRYAEVMGQEQGLLVASAINTVGADRNPAWVPLTGDGWPTYYIPALNGAGVPDITIEVGMNPVQGGKDFFESMADLEAALTKETLGWLDARENGYSFRDLGFVFAINWLPRPAAGSVTDYDSRTTSGRYAPPHK